MAKMTQEECRNQYRDLNERALQLAKLLKERQIHKSVQNIKKQPEKK